MDVRKIGAFISDLRKHNNYTQAELAQLLNVSPQAVSKWERGESMPDISLLPLMAKLLGVTVDELLNGERHHAPSSVEQHVAAAVEQPGEPEYIQMHAGHPGHAGHKLTIDQVCGLAPFMSKDALNTMIERAEGDVNWTNVNALAPFLGRTTLEKLVDRVIDGTIEVKRILNIAPFLGHETLDRLIQYAENGGLDGEVIARLGPFLSKDTLSRLVQKVTDGSMAIENILGLAPFLEQSVLIKLIEDMGMNGLRTEHLKRLAPFLPKEYLEKLVLGDKPVLEE